ncbi:unnamed protein product [Orchesella dallaii]|uniref:BTB domain-containing protein n=1 Tax=Orchesella dallaii TaxID=48710 RepID=A0ABP1R209_9HEXA
MNSKLTRFSMANNSNTNYTISQAETLKEVDTIWELRNWNRDFETLKTKADCFMNIGSGIDILLFFKEDFHVTVEADWWDKGCAQQKTEYLSLCLYAYHLEKRDVAIKLRLSIHYLSSPHLNAAAKGSDSYSTTRGMTYPYPHESVIKVDTINNPTGKIVIEKFIPISSTPVGANAEFHSKTFYKKPESLKFGITAQLLSVTLLEKAAIDIKPNHSISRDFMLMLKDEDNYADIKLETEDGIVIDAHKFVLAARSPVLRAQIEKNVKMNTFNGVIMVDMESKTLEHILKWMYSGEFDEIVEAKLDSILHAAVAYELTDLLITLDKKLIQICTVENMLQLMMTAKRLKLPVAMKQIAQFIKENVDKIAA